MTEFARGDFSAAPGDIFLNGLRQGDENGDRDGKKEKQAYSGRNQSLLGCLLRKRVALPHRIF